MLPERQVAVQLGFRDHKQVKMLLRLFSHVVLHSVKLTVMQMDEPVDTEVYTREVFSFGLAPRDTSHTVANSSVVGYLPHLALFTTSSSPRDVVRVWGVGGEPFPPQMQTVLSAAEVEAKHPEVLLGSHHDAKPSSDEERVAIRVEFEVACSGSGFGAVY